MRWTLHSAAAATAAAAVAGPGSAAAEAADTIAAAATADRAERRDVVPAGGCGSAAAVASAATLLLLVSPALRVVVVVVADDSTLPLDRRCVNGCAPAAIKELLPIFASSRANGRCICVPRLVMGRCIFRSRCGGIWGVLFTLIYRDRSFRVERIV